VTPNHQLLLFFSVQTEAVALLLWWRASILLVLHECIKLELPCSTSFQSSAALSLSHTRSCSLSLSVGKQHRASRRHGVLGRAPVRRRSSPSLPKLASPPPSLGPSEALEPLNRHPLAPSSAHAVPMAPLPPYAAAEPNPASSGRGDPSNGCSTPSSCLLGGQPTPPRLQSTPARQGRPAGAPALFAATVAKVLKNG
jgi:hypothetical protein